MKKFLNTIAACSLLAFFMVGCGSDESGSSPASLRSDSSVISTGQAGSMARFAINGNYLYTVDNSSLRVFNISNASGPKQENVIQLNFGVETIFPYKNNLFIGSQTGMYIYDVSSPANPAMISVYQHNFSCDPVVVNDDYAFVTLRSGTACRADINRLEILDIKNLKNPTLIKEYAMKNPKGLGLDFNTLFLCDDGLKVFNTADVLNLQLTDHFRNIDTYDVIPANGNLLMVASDGYYQYSYANGQLQLISKLPVN